MSAWDPWWVHGDYAETYHGAPDEEDDLAELEAQMNRENDLVEEEDLWTTS